MKHSLVIVRHPYITMKRVVECGYSVLVRNTFGSESGGRSKETVRGERRGDPRSTTVIKRPVGYKKATKILFVVSLL